MSAARFWERGYAVAHDIVTPQQLAFLRAAMDASARDASKTIGTRVAPQAGHNEYAPVAGEAILLACRAAVEATIGREILPAYAYWRIYAHGAELLRHKDRGACEISVTLPVFADPADDRWPICVTGLDGQDAAVPIAPGDGVLYQGCRVKHWREPFGGRRHYQLFLHYVLADGPNAVLVYDGRTTTSARFRALADG